MPHLAPGRTYNVREEQTDPREEVQAEEEWYPDAAVWGACRGRSSPDSWLLPPEGL